MEETVVDADIMHIATVEGKIGRTEILLPFPAVERLAILIVIADDGEEAHLRRAQCLAYLTLQFGVVTAIILYIIAHAEPVDRCSGRQRTDGLPDVRHRLGSESFYIALLNGIIIRRSIVRAVGIGNLRVADDNHLIVNLLAARQSGEGEVIGFLPLGYLLIEESRAIGLRMGRNLAIGWNRIVYEFCQAVSFHLISALCIGFHTVESIAHDDASHSRSFLIS